MGMFVCGADIAFKNGQQYAIEPTGRFGTIEEAVRCNKGLHPSFGYDIFEVETDATSGLKRNFGYRQGSSCQGFKVIAFAGVAYEHPAWHQQV